MKRNRWTRVLPVWTMLMLVFSVIVIIPGEADAAARYDLPTGIAQYYNEADEGEPVAWKLNSTDTYKYDKRGNMVYYGNKYQKIKTKWKYKKGKAIKSKTGSKKAGFILDAKYKKGRIKSISSKMYYKKKVVARTTGKFTYKKGWIKKFSGKADGRKYTESFSWTLYANGMPKTLKVKAKVGKRSYKYSYLFRDDGLIAKDRDFTYSYTKDASGRVVERITYLAGDPFNRTVYTYGSASTTNKKTYIGVMNDGGGGDMIEHWVRESVPTRYGMFAK